MSGKSTVLIVDDAPVNLMLLNGLLRDDYSVKATNNGSTALQIAADAPQPDLILLDILMPEMDGYEVCRKLKNNATTQNIPVVFISALSDTFDIVKAFEVGGVDFITKPFQPLEVKSRVKTHLEVYTARQELQTLLSQTLIGSIKMVIDLLSLMQPHLMEQSIRVRRHVREMIKNLAVSHGEAWNIELATMLFPLGCMGISPEMLHRRQVGRVLSREELENYASHIDTGADMIARIPRMETVAAIIRNQQPAFQLSPRAGNDITSLGSAMLQMLLTYDALTAAGKDPASALDALQAQSYPTRLMDGVSTHLPWRHHSAPPLS
ncbi:MAG: response regulator [Negativicutes bacterium]